MLCETAFKPNSHQTINPTDSHRRPPIKESVGIGGRKSFGVINHRKNRPISHRFRPPIFERQISNLFDIVSGYQGLFLKIIIFMSYFNSLLFFGLHMEIIGPVSPNINKLLLVVLFIQCNKISSLYIIILY